MMTDRTRQNMEILLVQVDFDRSVAAQEERYKKLKEDYDKVCGRLCGKLDDRRLELFREMMGLRDQIEYEHDLYYLWQGILRGTSIADKIERSNGRLILY